MGGACGACQRRAPIGAAAYRILSSRFRLAVVFVSTFDLPFPCIQSRAFIMHSSILLVAKVNKEIIGRVLRELARGEGLIKWTGVERSGRNLRDESIENQRAKLEKRHIASSASNEREEVI